MYYGRPEKCFQSVKYGLGDHAVLCCSCTSQVVILLLRSKLEFRPKVQILLGAMHPLNFLHGAFASCQCDWWEDTQRKWLTAARDIIHPACRVPRQSSQWSRVRIVPRHIYNSWDRRNCLLVLDACMPRDECCVHCPDQSCANTVTSLLETTSRWFLDSLPLPRWQLTSRRHRKVCNFPVPNYITPISR